MNNTLYSVDSIVGWGNKEGFDMKRTLICETYDSPNVIVDNDKGLIEITGKSTLPDPVGFYTQLEKIIEEYLRNTPKRMIVNFKLSYINTSSSKWIFHLLKQMEAHFNDKISLIINWFYDDDDEVIQEAGHDYQAVIKIPINLVMN